MLPNLLAHHYQSPPHQVALVPAVVVQSTALASTSSTQGQLEVLHDLRHYGLEVLLVRLQHPYNLLMYKVKDCCLLGQGQAWYQSRTTSNSITSTRCHACKQSSNPLQVTTTLAPHSSVFVVLGHTRRGRLYRSRWSVLTSRLLVCDCIVVLMLIISSCNVDLSEEKLIKFCQSKTN